MESSVHCPSPQNTYSYVQEENSGSAEKFVEKYLLFLCITNQIHVLHQQSLGWMYLSKIVGKKFLHPTHSECYHSRATHSKQNLFYPGRNQKKLFWEGKGAAEISCP
jgi:hypothetical protein